MRIWFCDERFTRFTGVYLLRCLLRRLDLRRRFQRELCLSRRNSRYCVGEELLALLYPKMLGIRRIEATHLLRHNGRVAVADGTAHLYRSDHAAPLFDLPGTLPDRASAPPARSVAGTQDAQTRSPTRCIFDLDSTVLVLLYLHFHLCLSTAATGPF